MIVGIDLGTANSAAAILENGETRLIPNALGDLLTPSAVADAKLRVAALEKLRKDPAACNSSSSPRNMPAAAMRRSF